MKKQIIVTIIIVIAILGIAGFIVYKNNIAPSNIIGGDRDEYGCLGPAGYSFDLRVGACTRGFELTDDIARAAQMAVEKVGKGYALTVVSFNSYEEVGAYDIMMERGLEREPQTIIIRNGVATIAPNADGQTFTQTTGPINCLPEQRNIDASCLDLFEPVCATVEIQCITTPCNPIEETFSSSCTACKNRLVKS